MKGGAMFDFILVILQLIGLAVVLGIILVFFVILYAGLAYQVHLYKARRREAYLSKKFFQRVEEYHNDLA
jgi:hypothetical protein